MALVTWHSNNILHYRNEKGIKMYQAKQFVI